MSTMSWRSAAQRQLRVSQCHTPVLGAVGAAQKISDCSLEPQIPRPQLLKCSCDAGSQVVLAVKNLPGAGDVRDVSPTPGREAPLEHEMAAHSSILAWRIPWTEESGGLPSMGSQRAGRN